MFKFIFRTAPIASTPRLLARIGWNLVQTWTKIIICQISFLSLAFQSIILPECWVALLGYHQIAMLWFELLSAQKYARAILKLRRAGHFLPNLLNWAVFGKSPHWMKSSILGAQWRQTNIVVRSCSAHFHCQYTVRIALVSVYSCKLALLSLPN